MASVPRIPATTLPTSAAQPPISGISLTELLANAKVALEKAMPRAVWVRAEIARIDRRKAMMFLDLTEQDEDGTVIARCEGRIWDRDLARIDALFSAVTGEPLKKGIKVLCLGRVKLHESHGLALHIENIDPAYTLGELAVRLARIREKLREEQIEEKNRRLPAPLEFVRVAIISPQSSAGLEDFRREADYLQECGLCDFAYFAAAFQSQDASKSIRDAILAAHTLHQSEPLDAIAIIRGGGSAIDLSWLNDYQLARWVCRVPIPVFTGIGHKRDDTILDEVCHTRFDTPSKVVLHILGTIWKNAMDASRAVDSIRERVTSLLASQERRLDEASSRIQSGVATGLSGASARCDHDMRLIRTSLGPRLRESAAALEAKRQSVRTGAAAILHSTVQDVEQLAWVYRERSTSRLTLVESAIDQQLREIRLAGLAQLERADAALASESKRLAREAEAEVRAVSDDVDREWLQAQRGARAVLDNARKAVELEVRSVVASGPEATLRRGFALARDDGGQAVTSRAAATRLPSFELQFHDGSMQVLNPERENGDE